MDYFSDNDVKPNISHSSNSDSHTMSRSGYSLQGEELVLMPPVSFLKKHVVALRFISSSILDSDLDILSKDTQRFDKHIM